MPTQPKKILGLTMPQTRKEKITAGVVGVLALLYIASLSPTNLRQQAAEINAKQFAEETRQRGLESAAREKVIDCMVSTGVSEPFDRSEVIKMLNCLAAKGYSE